MRHDSSRFVVGGLLALATLVIAPRPAAAQGSRPVDLVGQWASRNGEDAPYRGPGGFLGDYTGLPINAASRQMASSWDADSHSQPERSTQAHPVQYSMRGEGPNMRISELRDPATDGLVALKLIGMYGRSDRTIWMDGRAHPNNYAEHTWDGFSTGTFHDGVLTVVTTHMKMGVIQKVGVYTSPNSVMTEHFWRHGQFLTSVSIIEDPVYLEEPFVRTSTWQVEPAQVVVPIQPWDAVVELVDKAAGWVPHSPPGTEHREPSKLYDIPYEATLGGAATMYPEYQVTIAKLREQERARLAEAAAAKAPAAKAGKK